MPNPHIDMTAPKELDQQLFELVKGIDILSAVEPQNFQEQKSAFFDSNFSVNPAFQYNAHNIDVFQRKRALFNLPIETLKDEDLVQLYSDVIESYVDKLDQFRSVGTPEFVYDSLRYFGEPSEKDIGNANFILHFPDDPAPSTEPMMNAQEIVDYLSEFADQRGYTYSINLNDRMIANALVSGNTVKVNSRALVSETEVKALAHHELGVHLVTTLNARSQPLQILTLGCPVNTTTQEGLAILCEYLAGHLTLPRLKVLALRVIAVQSMLHDKDFKKTFLLLKEQYQVPNDMAFTITTRVYRGGGFTKDFLYLKGFHKLLNAYESRDDFNHLMAGKVSIDHLPLISKLIDKGYLLAPGFISPAIEAPQQVDAVKQFLAHAIK